MKTNTNNQEAKLQSFTSLKNLSEMATVSTDVYIYICWNGCECLKNVVLLAFKACGRNVNIRVNCLNGSTGMNFNTVYNRRF